MQKEETSKAPYELLNTREVAKILKCSTREVQRLVKAHKLPAPARIMGMVRWNAECIRHWIGKNCNSTKDQEGGAE